MHNNGWRHVTKAFDRRCRNHHAYEETFDDQRIHPLRIQRAKPWWRSRRAKLGEFATPSTGYVAELASEAKPEEFARGPDISASRTRRPYGPRRPFGTYGPTQRPIQKAQWVYRSCLRLQMSLHKGTNVKSPVYIKSQSACVCTKTINNLQGDVKRVSKKFHQLIHCFTIQLFHRENHVLRREAIVASTTITLMLASQSSKENNNK